MLIHFLPCELKREMQKVLVENQNIQVLVKLLSNEGSHLISLCLTFSSVQ